ncbi:MAG: metal-dependent transcriptional regulator, partial [Clostridia bacterium]|nr:metal-dependent transcriptional regulator [Clostridia bacterium]
MPSQAMEDYLLAIYRLEDLGRRPGTGEVAQELGVSAASTTAMFKRLAQEGLVSYREYGGVSLSERGRAVALGLIRRHRLAERFLTDLLDLPWEGVHEIADRLEHALPPEVIERFAGLLGDPRTCPHGHPIPTTDGRMPEIDVRPLRSVEVGETAVRRPGEARHPPPVGPPGRQ